MQSQNETMPFHWELLSDEDKAEYLSIKARFHDEIAKSKRGERIDVFVSRLKIIRDFIQKDNVDQWKRTMVCGIMFLNSALGINIQQLRLLLGKCKSSINGSLQQLGYVAKPSTHEIDQEITRKIPFLKDDHFELKKWTIRYGQFPDNGVRIKPKEIAEKHHQQQQQQQQGLIKPVQNLPPQMIPLQMNMQQQPIFIQQQPIIGNMYQSQQQKVSAQHVMHMVNTKFPCPAKCRHKLYDLIHSSISIQTEA